MHIKTFKIQKLGQKHDYMVFQLRKSHLKLRLKWKVFIKYELKRLSYLTYIDQKYVKYNLWSLKLA